MGSDIAPGPFEFLPQDVRERRFRHHGKRQRLWRESEDHFLGRAERMGRAAVDGHKNMLVSGGRDDHFTLVRNNQGAVAQDMRTNGCDDKRPAIRHENGTSCRQGVGSRTGGCGHDQSIGVIFGQRCSIHGGLKFDKLGAFTATDGDIIESTFERNNPVRA
jgi:hypothetical protein